MPNGATMKLKPQVISQDTISINYFRFRATLYSCKLTRITKTTFSAENYLWKVEETEEELEGVILNKFNMNMASKPNGTLFAQDKSNTEVEKWSLVPG